MHTPFKYFAILTFIAQLPQLTLSDWRPGKAAQINFYVGGACAQYTAEMNSRWTSSPLVGGNRATTEAQCFLLNMPGDSTGINTATMWEESTTSDTVEPAQANGWCMFWDGFDCTGNTVSSDYVPEEAEGGPCHSSWSKDGFMWKSAKCFIDAITTTPAGPDAPLPQSPPTSTPTTTRTSQSTTSLSTPIGHTPSTSSSSISLSTLALIASSHTSTTISSSPSLLGYASSISNLRYDRRRHSWCCFTGCTTRHPTRLLCLASRTKETRGDPPIPACVGTIRTSFRKIKRERGGHGGRLATAASESG
ncbi:hypothetical protein C8J57DRAFT_1711710 [Mycena rebaudengoi]|nr:hypothetical protein C8J57DRAFT_1711710 [Mycena rebaudengoi]